MPDFPIRRVDRNLTQSVETLGTKRKYWFFDGERKLMFKAEDRGTGDDWAEVIASHLCGLLGLPHVEYELAVECAGPKELRPGVICENMVPEPLQLCLGNQMIFADAFDPKPT